MSVLKPTLTKREEKKLQTVKTYLTEYDEINGANDTMTVSQYSTAIMSFTQKENDKYLMGDLFLGGLGSLDKVDKYNIGLVVSLEQPTCDFSNKTILHIRYTIRDEMDDKTLNILQKILPEAVEIIHECLMSGINVLVHCAAGVSRSATVVLSYLMKHQFKGSLMKSLIFLKKHRNCIFPNGGFLKLLIKEDTS